MSDGIFAGEGRHGAVADRDEACRTSVCSAALLMADGRFPAGGYAHSGGLEGAVDEGALNCNIQVTCLKYLSGLI